MMTDAVLAKLLGVEAIDGYASGREPTPPELGTRLNSLLALIGDLEGVQTRCTVETRLDALSAPVYWWVEGDASGRSQVREGPRTF